MQRVFENEKYRLLKYTPTVLSPFYDNMDHLTIFKRIRFFIEYFYGYTVYYLQDKSGELMGYCTISSGRNKRYWFADEHDIILGPYFIKEKYRGRGLSVVLISLTLDAVEFEYRDAYDYINKDNLPSIKATERLGGEKVFSVSINVITRQMKKDNDGQYEVYRLTKKKGT